METMRKKAIQEMNQVELSSDEDSSEEVLNSDLGCFFLSCKSMQCLIHMIIYRSIRLSISSFKTLFLKTFIFLAVFHIEIVFYNHSAVINSFL